MPGQMMKFSPELFEALLKALGSLGIRTDEKSMFGHRTLFINGHMFAGASADGIWMRVGEDQAGPALAGDADLSPFEPRKGMIMKGYIVVKRKARGADKKLEKWLRAAAGHVQRMPPKKTAGKKGSGRRP